MLKLDKEWRTTFDSISDYISVNDNDFRFVRVNKALADFLGKKPSELVGKFCYKELCEIDEPSSNCPHVMANKSEEPVTKEMYFPNFGKHFLIVASPIIDEAGEKQGIVHYIKDITERKKADDVLHEIKEHYRAVVEDQTEVICRFYSDGTFTFVNEVYCRFFGKSKEELIGKKWFPVAHKDDLKMIQAKLQTMSPSNQVVLIENRVYSGDGDMRWYQFVNRGLYDQEGNLLEIQSVGRDITERKKSEDELLRTKERMQSFMDSATEGFVIYDAELNLVDINHKALEIFPSGDSKETLVGKNILEIVPNLKQAGRYDKYLEVIKTGKSIYLDDIVPDSRFGNRYLTIKAFKSGENLGIIFTDITERRKTERELKNMFNLALDMMCVCTPEGKFTKVNPSCGKVLGYTTDEILELGWAKLVHPDDMEETNKEVERQLAGNPTANFTNRFRCKDGTYKILEWQATPSIEGIVYATARNVTERKKAEEQIYSQKRDIEIMINSSQDIIFLKDENLKYLIANKSAAESLNAKIEDVIGKDDFQFMPKEIAEICRKSDIEALGSEGPVEKEEFYGGMCLQVVKQRVKDANGDIVGVASVIRDITERKQAEEQLEAKNIALREVLEQLEIEKDILQKNILANIDELILPALKKFKPGRTSSRQINMFEKNLENLASSFGRRVTDKKFMLTPKEIELCNMIKSDFSNKDIANHLNLSVQTIEKHRKNIRHKLGIVSKKVNLRTYLQHL